MYIAPVSQRENYKTLPALAKTIKYKRPVFTGLLYFMLMDVVILRAGLPRLHRPNAEGTHHFVILVLNDMTVPDELAGVLNCARTRVTCPG